jgi:NADPH:quinone reductase-like Zn-dependent oxidoreductase
LITMKAVRIHSYGGSGVLSYEEAPLPAVGEDEVLIRVHATSVNPFDWKVREGSESLHTRGKIVLQVVH